MALFEKIPERRARFMLQDPDGRHVLIHQSPHATEYPGALIFPAAGDIDGDKAVESLNDNFSPQLGWDDDLHQASSKDYDLVAVVWEPQGNSRDGYVPGHQFIMQPRSPLKRLTIDFTQPDIAGVERVDIDELGKIQAFQPREDRTSGKFVLGPVVQSARASIPKRFEASTALRREDDRERITIRRNGPNVALTPFFRAAWQVVGGDEDLKVSTRDGERPFGEAMCHALESAILRMMPETTLEEAMADIDSEIKKFYESLNWEDNKPRPQIHMALVSLMEQKGLVIGKNAIANVDGREYKAPTLYDKTVAGLNEVKDKGEDYKNARQSLDFYKRALETNRIPNMEDMGMDGRGYEAFLEHVFDLEPGQVIVLKSGDSELVFPTLDDPEAVLNIYRDSMDRYAINRGRQREDEQRRREEDDGRR